MITTAQAKNILFGPDVNSATRLNTFLELCPHMGPSAWWCTFHDTWDACDDTRDHHAELIKWAQHHGRRRRSESWSAEQRAFFGSLPVWVTVYRGCDANFTDGMSWTTDLEVAKGFARGHRQYRPANPVVISMEVPRSMAMTVFNDRAESEILIDPCAIDGFDYVEVENLNPAQAA